MTQGRSILAHVSPRLSDEAVHRFVGNVTAIARQLGENVHFLTPPRVQAAVNSALCGLTNQGALAIKVVSHPIDELTPAEIHRRADSFSCDLIVVAAESLEVPRDNGAPGTQIRENLLEQYPTPILILTSRTDTRNTLHLRRIPYQNRVQVFCVQSPYNQ